MHAEITNYNDTWAPTERAICRRPAEPIDCRRTGRPERST